MIHPRGGGCHALPVAHRRGLALRLGAGGVFFLSGVGKALAFSQTTDRMGSLLPLPTWMVPGTAALLIAAELCTGGLLISGMWCGVAARVGAVMAAGFLAAAMIMMQEGVEGCGCFGILLDPPVWVMLAVDVGLAAACFKLAGTAGCGWGTAQRARAQATPTRVGGSAPGVRAAGLGLACCVGLAVLVDLAPTSPVMLRRIGYARGLRRSDEQRQAQLKQWRAHDPPLGTVLPTPGGRSGRVTVVLVIDACTRCNLAWVRAAERLASDRPGVDAVVIAAATARDVGEFRRSYHVGVRVVADPVGRLARRYNAAWTPRAYLLARGGALRWCQPGATPDFGEIARVIEREEGQP